MVQVTIRQADGCNPETFRLWDTEIIYNGQFAPHMDWSVAGPEDTDNFGGLSGVQGLRTGVLLQLFTNRRAPDDHPLRSGFDDPMGWWGNSVGVRVDNYEEELGSLLWMLARAPFDDQTPLLAETMTREALQPILNQGAVARFDVNVVETSERHTLCIDISAFSVSGEQVYSEKFHVLWQQELRLQQQNDV